MATATHKRLGAIVSSGVIGTADLLYTCPTLAVGGVAISTIVVCNRHTVSATYRLCTNTAAAFADAGYLVYGGVVPANDSVFLTLGITLDPAGKYLLASASAATVSFSVFGAEIT